MPKLKCKMSEEKNIYESKIRSVKDLVAFEVTETALKTMRLYSILMSRIRTGNTSDLAEDFRHFSSYFEHLYELTGQGYKNTEELEKLFHTNIFSYDTSRRANVMNKNDIVKWLDEFKKFKVHLINSNALNLTYNIVKSGYEFAEGLED